MKKNIKFYELSNFWLEKALIGVCYTYQQNLYSYIRHLNTYLGNKTVTAIKPYDIDIIINELATCNPNTSKPSSKKLLKNIVQCAYNIFDLAIENEVLTKNPARNKKKDIPKNAPQKNILGITPHHQQLVIEVEHRAKIAAVLMMFTGLRTGELLALNWSDIDFHKMEISINKRTQRTDTNTYTIMPGTKNGKCRKTAVPNNLGQWLMQQQLTSNSCFICPNKSGQLQTPTQWRSLWRSYQNQINYYVYTQKSQQIGKYPAHKHSPNKIPILEQKFTPHQLRHTYATLLYQSGVDVMTASELLGHSNISTTLKIYTHLDKQFKELNISKFDQYIKSDLDIDSI